MKCSSKRFYSILSVVSGYLACMFIPRYLLFFFFFSSRRRHTCCELVTGVQTCALPIFAVSPFLNPSKCAPEPPSRSLRDSAHCVRYAFTRCARSVGGCATHPCAASCGLAALAKPAPCRLGDSVPGHHYRVTLPESFQVRARTAESVATRQRSLRLLRLHSLCSFGRRLRDASMRRVLRTRRATLTALYPSYLQWSGIGLEPMAARNASTPSADGLVVLRASRLEALLQPLQTLLASTRPDNVLVAQDRKSTRLNSSH